MLISVSCDCETVKNVVKGNSSLKPDRTGRDGKFVKQSKMLNNSAYSRLGNNMHCRDPQNSSEWGGHFQGRIVRQAPPSGEEKQAIKKI